MLYRHLGPELPAPGDGAPTILLHRFGRTAWTRLRRGYSGYGSRAVVAPVTRAAPAEPKASTGPVRPALAAPVPAAEDEAAADAHGAMKEADAAETTQSLPEQDGAFLAISEEAQAARAKGIPAAPDLETRRLHRLNHWPYRAWCRWCVCKGAGAKTRIDGDTATRTPRRSAWTIASRRCCGWC